MKHIIATLLLAGASFGALGFNPDPTYAATTPTSDQYTPIICVMGSSPDGCTDGGPGKPRR
ncbi:MAG: hypothetical protein JWN73_1698 [Betaproteobacteria bacterium]|nr:hypothetical protein [Betaproteobacteria bacterium]